MEKIQMTEREKEIVTELNHELYTVEYLEHWLNRNDSVALNASAALQAMGAHGFYEAVKRMAAGSSHSGEWIPCSERMPKNEENVEITYIRKHYRTGETLYLTGRAFYTDGTMTTEDSVYYWEDCDFWEHDEEKDAYIIPEGWWEYVSFGEKFAGVNAEVIAWKPLTEPYKEAGV